MSNPPSNIEIIGTENNSIDISFPIVSDAIKYKIQKSDDNNTFTTLTSDLGAINNFIVTNQNGNNGFRPSVTDKVLHIDGNLNTEITIMKGIDYIFDYSDNSLSTLNSSSNFFGFSTSI